MVTPSPIHTVFVRDQFTPPEKPDRVAATTNSLEEARQAVMDALWDALITGAKVRVRWMYGYPGSENEWALYRQAGTGLPREGQAR